MRWPPLLAALAVALTALGAARAGDPGQGAAVWVDAGCGSCHAFAKAGSTGSAAGNAPNLDRWLVPDAMHVGLPVDQFAYRRIYFGGRGMPAFGTTLGAQELDDLVSFVAGHPFTAPAGTPAPLAPLPAPPPLVTATPKTVARWTKQERLPKQAVAGATLFAKTGCLSCHTYLGSGKSRRGGGDLSKIGAAGKSAAWFRRYVARPYAYGNTLMPTYADLTPAQLARLSAFLAASR